MDRGDLSWEAIRASGDVTIHDRSSLSEVRSQIGDAAIAVSNSIHYDRALLSVLPSLRCICLLSTGTDKVDVDYARERGIAVYNCPAYSTDSTAEHVFALIFALARRVEAHSQMVKDGYWSTEGVFSCWHYPQRQLSGKTIGIVGYGAVGARVASIAGAFAMRVIVHSRRGERAGGDGMRWVSLADLLRQADIVSLHCPLTDATRNMIDNPQLAMMKTDAYLINSARGQLVNQQALHHALVNRVIAAAAVDVLHTEPPAKHEPLYGVDNCIITPHCAWSSREARQRLIQYGARAIARFIAEHGE